MVNFSIGLSLLISGFTLYKLANIIVAATVSPAGVAAPQTAKTLAEILSVPSAIVPFVPYIGVIVMLIGVVWFWLIKALLHFTRPQKADILSV